MTNYNIKRVKLFIIGRPYKTLKMFTNQNKFILVKRQNTMNKMPDLMRNSIKEMNQQVYKKEILLLNMNH